MSIFEHAELWYWRQTPRTRRRLVHGAKIAAAALIFVLVIWAVA